MEARRRQTDDMVSVGRDVPATRRDLASVERSLTLDIANLRNEVWRNIADLEAQAIRRDIRGQFEGISREMRGIVFDMRDLRREARTIKWMAAATLAGMTLITIGVVALALS